MLAVFFAFISFFGWGIGDIFGAITTRKIGAYSAVYWNIVFGFIISTLYIPFLQVDQSSFTILIISINVILGIIFILGFIAFNEGLRIANPTLIGTIVASFAAFTVVFSIIFFKETVTLPQVLSISTIFIGLIPCSFSIKKLPKWNTKQAKGILLAFFAMLCWGLYYTFIKIPVKQIGWFWPQYITLSLFPLLFFYMKINHRKLSPWNKQNVFLPLVANGILVTIGEFSFNFAISKGLSAVVAPIAGAYPVLFAIIAFFLFKDHISKQQLLGIIISLLGIVSLATFSI